MTATLSGGGPAVSEPPDRDHADRRWGPSSAAKVLAILDVFAGPRAVLGVTELARAIGVPKSTAHRLLSVLIESGYLRKVGGRYTLTERVFELGNRVGSVRSTGFRHRAMPYLAGLFVGTRETVHLATMSGTDVLYLEKLFGHSKAQCSTAVGTRRPVYATALGKAMLAFSSDAVLSRAVQGPFHRFTNSTVRDGDRLQRRLEEVRSTGLATDHGEMHPAVHCVAAPVVDPWTHQAIAAVSICSLTTHNVEAKYGHLVLETARELSQVALGGSAQLP
ncbi:IclR family transcriptional regulator [Amycolatopsis pithecellobii]|nr:IclR family transcriptional regulator [Amycolatopsis pithecellobii]